MAVSRIRVYILLKTHDCRSWESENLELKSEFVLKIYAVAQVLGR
jgi:hypothetical protein